MTRAGICSWIVGLAAALPAAAWAEAAYTTTAVNLRAGPDADYPLVRWVPEGTAVDVHGCLADYRWCDVEVFGDRGWMSASYLVYPYQNSAVPVVTYGAVIGLPLIGFTFDSYWHDHYRGRPWYDNRQRWADRYRPEYHAPRYREPRYREPQYYPPQHRPPQRPPQFHPPSARPPEFRPPTAQPQPMPPQYRPDSRQPSPQYRRDDRRPDYRQDNRPQQPNYRPPSARPPGPAAPPQVVRPPSQPPTSQNPTPGRSPRGLHNDAGERGGITTGNF